MMTHTIDYFLVPQSPWTYFGHARFVRMAAEAGATVRIKLDPRFMSDFLRVLDPAAAVTVELTDAQSACVCSTDDGYGYVIMPLAAD
jgi:predicted DsbA family dithiol-disulfide isomerase